MIREYLGIKIDDDHNNKFTELALKTLEDRYMVEGETSPQEALARAAVAFADDLDHAQRIYDYAAKQWFMFATPILSNGGTDRGLGVSCYLEVVGDSRRGLSQHYDENIWLASNGGGIGAYWGDVRSDGQSTSCGSKSSGSIPFLHVVDSQMMAFNQGSTRRGSYAAYQNISHPEIDEFVGMRKPTGGDIHRKCLNLHHGVNIPDSFMEMIEKCMKDKDADDSWDLIDPHSKRIVRTVSGKELWARVLETRVATGEPYIHYIDRSNEFLPQTQKALGLKVNLSNLCVEITEATDALRTAVCCLSSLNLSRWEEWKDIPQFIRDIVRFLDNVLEVFIWSVFSKDKKTELLSLSHTYDVKIKNSNGNLSESDQKEFLVWLSKICNPNMEGLKKAAFSAFRERSIGLGTMGLHSLLQSKMIPFESAIAMGLNRQIFKHIKEEAIKETELLATERGEAPDMRGSGRRNAHLLAVAPNASSSILCGEQYTSPSVEPFRAVAYTAKTLSGSFLQKNPYLQALLESKNLPEKKVEKIWKSIIGNRGSCQHVEELDEWEKMVFKTALEVDQHWIIEHAATRQEFICQSQSLNLFFRPSDEIKYLHDVHFAAWKKGLKTLYYCRSESLRSAENVETKIERRVIDTEGCISCEG